MGGVRWKVCRKVLVDFSYKAASLWPGALTAPRRTRKFFFRQIFWRRGEWRQCCWARIRRRNFADETINRLTRSSSVRSPKLGQRGLCQHFWQSCHRHLWRQNRALICRLVEHCYIFSPSVIDMIVWAQHSTYCNLGTTSRQRLPDGFLYLYAFITYFYWD